MQVDTSCHRVKIPSQILKSKKISNLDWPGNTPDPNAFGNLWTVLKNKVSERQPSRAKGLEYVIENVWVRDISTKYC